MFFTKQLTAQNSIENSLRRCNMLITDKRALAVLSLIKSKGIIRFETEFCAEIGLLKQNLQKIKNPKKYPSESNSFTAEQLYKIGEAYDVNMNYLFGFSDEPFRRNSL